MGRQRWHGWGHSAARSSLLHGEKPGAVPTLDYFAGDFTVHPNAATSIYPSATYDPVSNKTFYAWLCEGSPQLIRVASYSHSSGIFSQPVSAAKQTVFTDDAHGTPAICIDDEGYIYVFGLCHNNLMRWSISAAPRDVSAWKPQTAMAGQNSYAKPVMLGGSLYLFVRIGGSGSSKIIVRKATPSGGVATFGADVNLVDWIADTSGTYAAEVRALGDEIEFFVTQQLSRRRHIRYFAYHTITGAVRNLAGTVTVAAGSLPVDAALSATSFTEVDSGTNMTEIPSWCRTANGDLHLVYFNATNTTSPAPLYHMIHDGTGWSTPELVVSMLGYAFPRIRYLCLAPNGDNVELWYPDGRTGGWTFLGGDYIARRVWNGSWGPEEIIHEGDGVHALAHPSYVFNAHPDARMCFQECAQSEENADRFRAKRYIWGESGFLKWPVPPQYADAVVEEIVYQGANNSTPSTGLDRSFTLTDTVFVGNAKIFNNRLLLDGTGDYVQIGAATSAFNIRYRMWGARQDNDGEFALDVSKVKLANTTQTCAIYGRAGQTTNLSLALFYRGDSGNERFEAELSMNGTTATLLTWNIVPDTAREYDFRVSRDPTGQIRLHAAETGGPLVMRATASFGTGPLFQAGTVRPLHGAWSNTLLPMNGSLRGVRVTLDHRGTGDAELPSAIMDWAA